MRDQSISRRRTAEIKVRVSEIELAYFSQRAAAVGMTLAEMVRFAVRSLAERAARKRVA